MERMHDEGTDVDVKEGGGQGEGERDAAQPHDDSQPDRDPDAKTHAKRCRTTHPSSRGIHDEINYELPLKPSRPTHFLDVPIESGNAL